MKEIVLTQGQVALVDDDDFDLLSQWKWRASREGGRWYAVRMEGFPKRTLVRMHRQILNATSNEVDHIDRNGLNNCKSNLRVCSRKENSYNRGKQSNNKSGYKGVIWNKYANKWQAGIGIDKKYKYIGIFENIEDAARAYDEAAIAQHGIFACTNFVPVTRIKTQKQAVPTA